MKTELREYVYIGMIDDAYERFNELLGFEIYFEGDQNYGTSCYGILPAKYINPDIKDLASIPEKYISSDDVLSYLVNVGEIPKDKDILFHVDY